MNSDDDRPADLDDTTNDLESQASSALVDVEDLRAGDWATIEGRVAHIEAVHRNEDTVVVITGRERVAFRYGSLVERFFFAE